MALPAAVSDINAFTQADLVPRCTEIVYKRSPLFSRILTNRNVRVNFDGGTKIQRPLQYAKLNGGPFKKGGSFTTAYVVDTSALLLDIKFYYVDVSLYREDGVLNRGRNAAFSQTELKMANASLRMLELLSRDMFADGQSSDADSVTSSNILSTSISLDGLLAWIDDGNDYSTYSTATDVTKAFTAIGGITRSELFASAPTFAAATTPAAGMNMMNSYVDRGFSVFSLNTINKAFGYASYGNEQPDLIATTQNGYNRFWNAIQPLQRYEPLSTDLSNIGFKGFRFNTMADVVVDQYMPEQLMLGINTEYLEMYVSEDPLFQFGFTGFKEGRNDLQYSGQFLFAGNLIHANPRTCFKLVGDALS